MKYPMGFISFHDIPDAYPLPLRNTLPFFLSVIPKGLLVYTCFLVFSLCRPTTFKEDRMGAANGIVLETLE